MDTKRYDDAQQVYYLVQKIYNRWKINNALIETSEHCEFGMDDYIRVKSRYAESIMNSGNLL
jgi:hypothetical protein